MNTEIQKIVVNHFFNALNHSNEKDITFRSVVTYGPLGSAKPLLIVGVAHQPQEDGSCIAILNPDKDLVNKIHAGCAISGPILKEMVSKKCDHMQSLVIQSYKDLHVQGASSYTSRNPQPAKFIVR